MPSLTIKGKKVEKRKAEPVFEIKQAAKLEQIAELEPVFKTKRRI